jgi:hypothetical protein
MRGRENEERQSSELVWLEDGIYCHDNILLRIKQNVMDTSRPLLFNWQTKPKYIPIRINQCELLHIQPCQLSIKPKVWKHYCTASYVEFIYWSGMDSRFLFELAKMNTPLFLRTLVYVIAEGDKAYHGDISSTLDCNIHMIIVSVDNKATHRLTIRVTLCDLFNALENWKVKKTTIQSPYIGSESSSSGNALSSNLIPAIRCILLSFDTR